MDDLDAVLTRMAHAPVPASLDGMEARVLERIGAQPFVARRAGLGIGVMTVVALGIGMAGAELPATASSAASLAPLGGASPLAPSALLIGEP